MRIFVCVKQVPDTSGVVAVNPDGTLNRASKDGSVCQIKTSAAHIIDFQLKIRGISQICFQQEQIGKGYVRLIAAVILSGIGIVEKIRIRRV